MTLASTPCSCGGNNPSCFRCWGTGMVEPKNLTGTGPKGNNRKSRGRGSSQSDGAIRGLSNTPAQPRKPLAICLKCGVSVRRIERHMAKAHGAAKSQMPQVSEKPVLLVNDASTQPVSRLAPTESPRDPRSERKNPSLHVCPVCAVQVKNLEKHAMKTGHGPMGSLFDKAVARSKDLTNQRPPDAFKCPHCPANFPNATQLASHVVGSHGKRAFQNLGYQERSSSIRPPDACPPGPMFERSTNMDAKHGWGGSFRDNGQFGSYPSHDGMDDESSA